MNTQARISTDSSKSITRLTALWAVSESGLGGIIHAMKIPLGAVLLAGFTVIVVTLIASISERKWRDILQATIIVILIKALASPHSPFTAYLAVLIQGLLGAVLYSILPLGYFSSISYGILALIESAVQKLLFLLLIFGTEMWQAFQVFSDSIARSMHFMQLSELPNLMLGAYLLIYLVGGIIAGIFAVKVPRLLQTEWDQISRLEPAELSLFETEKKKTAINRIWPLAFIIVFVASVFLFTESQSQGFYVLLRSVAALLVIFLIVNPLFAYFIRRWRSQTDVKSNQQLWEVMTLIPNFQNNARIAQNFATHENGIWRRIRKFVLAWLALSLNEKH